MNEQYLLRMLMGENLARKAGKSALEAFKNAELKVESKGAGDVVSEADFAIETMVRQSLSDAFPDDYIIGEEFGGDASPQGFTWLIDPIDGTVNFTRRLSYFCVSIALLSDGKTVAAWIFDPVLDELFHADPQGHAYLNHQLIACASASDFADAVISLGFSSRHDQGLGGIIVASLFAAGTENRRLGAGALSLAHAAAGRVDAYIEPHMNAWDAVGGLYIAACAGAVVCDYIGAGGLAHGAPVYAASPAISSKLHALLPPPFADISLLLPAKA